jgi:hypothetical protein
LKGVADGAAVGDGVSVGVGCTDKVGDAVGDGTLVAVAVGPGGGAVAVEVAVACAVAVATGRGTAVNAGGVLADKVTVGLAAATTGELTGATLGSASVAETGVRVGTTSPTSPP